MKNIKTTIENILKGNIPPDIYNVSDSITYTYSKLLTNHKKNNANHIPVFLLKFSFFLGQFLKNNFLIENSIKLISDNIYPSAKLRSFIKLPFS